MWRIRRPRPGRWRPVALVTAAVLVVAGGTAAGLALTSGPPDLRVTAWFDHTVGVYPGSDLRVLGVKVGTVDAVVPQGRRVRVTLTLDHGVPVPAGAHAVVVAPSVVADRYIQLTPAWTGGPRLADHAVIPVERTATPVEIDQLYTSVTDLADALGPKGANATGALSRLLDVGAANLKGNGKAMGETIDQLGQAASTLAGHRDDLFATLSYLQTFTAMLKKNDSQVRTAVSRLGDVSTFLAQDRRDLGDALRQLATALGEVKGFIQDNRARLRTSVDKLTPLTQALVDQRASLAELLDTAPLAADNALSAYDPAHRTLDGRGDLNELSMGPGAKADTGPPLPLPGVGTPRTGAAR
ncbi:virulence factor Mce family protein [Streptantibioticus cattleyicolor NRRL 8057 = DSM 46488]|uniref:Virulence factor Mce family protein n=1 Tax=Streptantibioticus cattleyicolor (strain ATCC 35852 / DSM 46488 / JCM 4925 / NBRC 14057 / NRRL 8057) TaxID=1003195 RepID=G8WZZ3_STREN|nr:MCE family protein [Streptantibioticus cattleyicolor]AEW95594.1 virulence factor Mce family protein [Streptantibioticus cattleyicolor NRRL 8057 = DSM 46488]